MGVTTGQLDTVVNTWFMEIYPKLSFHKGKTMAECKYSFIVLLQINTPFVKITRTFSENLIRNCSEKFFSMNFYGVLPNIILPCENRYFSFLFSHLIHNNWEILRHGSRCPHAVTVMRPSKVFARFCLRQQLQIIYQ